MSRDIKETPAVASIGEAGSSFNSIWYEDQVSRVWRIYLTDAIHDPESHQERIDLIRQAPEGDTIYIYITTPGGEIDIAEGYLDAIEHTQAKVITRAVGMVASAGTLIWMAGDERQVASRAAFMFHHAQMGAGYSDAKNLSVSVDFFERYYRESFTSFYQELLTEEEIERVFSAQEVYIRGTEMLRRLQALPEPVLVSTDPSQYGEEKTGISLTLQDGFNKVIPVDNITIEQFYEFSVPELRGILADCGVSGDLYLGVKKFEPLAQLVVDIFKKHVAGKQ